MASPVVTLIDGYPQSVGAKRQSAAVVQGPTSYSTGGFTLDAVSFGLTAFDFATATATAGGLHQVEVRFSGTTKAPPSQIKCIVYLSSSGLEVAAAVDLSASFFRVKAFGL